MPIPKVARSGNCPIAGIAISALIITFSLVSSGIGLGRPDSSSGPNFIGIHSTPITLPSTSPKILVGARRVWIFIPSLFASISSSFFIGSSFSERR